MLEGGLLSVVVGPVVFVSCPEHEPVVEQLLDSPGTSSEVWVFLVLPSCALNQHEGMDSRKGDTTKIQRGLHQSKQAVGWAGEDRTRGWGDCPPKRPSRNSGSLSQPDAKGCKV